MTQTLEPRIESSLLYIGDDGRQHFTHDSYRDFFLARYFADNKLNPVTYTHLRQPLVFYVGMIDDASDFLEEIIGRFQRPYSEEVCYFLGELTLNAKYVSENSKRRIVRKLYSYYERLPGGFALPDTKVIKYIAQIGTEESVRVLKNLMTRCYNGPSCIDTDGPIEWKEAIEWFNADVCRVAERLIHFGGENGIKAVIEYFGGLKKAIEFMKGYSPNQYHTTETLESLERNGKCHNKH